MIWRRVRCFRNPESHRDGKKARTSAPRWPRNGCKPGVGKKSELIGTYVKQISRERTKVLFCHWPGMRWKEGQFYSYSIDRGGRCLWRRAWTAIIPRYYSRSV